VWLRPGEDEGVQASSDVGAGIIPQGHKEVPEDALVDLQGGLGQAAMLGHPGTESPEQQPPVGRRRRRHRLRDHALLVEKPEEPAGGRKGLLACSAGMSRAALSRARPCTPQALGADRLW
jgi:hypothetical protein